MELTDPALTISNCNTRLLLLVNRFMSRVKQTRSGCWLWTGDRQHQKRVTYGLFTLSYKPRARIVAHKFMYILYHGAIPDGHEVAHTCHKGLCVYPLHLVAKTHVENLAMSKEG